MLFALLICFIGLMIVSLIFDKKIMNWLKNLEERVEKIERKVFFN